MAKKQEQQSLFSVDEFKKRSKSKKSEEKIQMEVCNYIKTKYPNVIFSCDVASGMRLPIHIAAKHKKMRSDRGFPDLFIAASRHENTYSALGYPMVKTYCGLFLELKKESVRLKNGNIARSSHHDEQAEILMRLNREGYVAQFACGYDEAVKLIDEYLSNENTG